MGCWNGTCAISNLPIFSGDQVKLIITKKQNHFDYNRHAVCYSDSIFEPVFLQLDAQYNDYGAVENIIENWNYNIISSSLIRKNIKLIADQKETENPYIQIHFIIINYQVIILIIFYLVMKIVLILMKMIYVNIILNSI